MALSSILFFLFSVKMVTTSKFIFAGIWGRNAVVLKQSSAKFSTATILWLEMDWLITYTSLAYYSSSILLICLRI